MAVSALKPQIPIGQPATGSSRSAWCGKLARCRERFPGCVSGTAADPAPIRAARLSEDLLGRKLRVALADPLRLESIELAGEQRTRSVNLPVAMDLEAPLDATRSMGPRPFDGLRDLLRADRLAGRSRRLLVPVGRCGADPGAQAGPGSRAARRAAVWRALSMAGGESRPVSTPFPNQYSSSKAAPARAPPLPPRSVSSRNCGLSSIRSRPQVSPVLVPWRAPR